MKMDYDKRILYVTREEYQVILDFALATSVTSESSLTPVTRKAIEGSLAPWSIQVVIDEEKAIGS